MWQVVGVAGKDWRWQDAEKLFLSASVMDDAIAPTSNTLPPEIASKRAEVARVLREHIYGEQALIDTNGHHETTLDTPADDLAMSPKVITRDVVATLENSRYLGMKLAAHA